MPLVGILGPRQSGKTTLAKALFPRYSYVNMELPDVRRFATDDPRGFLARYPSHAIFDEVQRVPELFSYLQVKTDEDKIPGQYILTGSQHFLMLSEISQTLAGRIALFTLYPLSYEELKAAKRAHPDPGTHIFLGGFPRLYDTAVNPSLWLSGYIQTYLERDVSLIAKIENLQLFDTFLHLIAGRTANLVNLSSIASDIGVTHNTIKTWIQLLVTSGLIYLLRPYHVNITSRLIKTPKLYMTDTGLACRLLGITKPEHLPTHPLYGQLFETFIVNEFYKHQTNHQKGEELYFWRNRKGLEADLYIHRGTSGLLCEIKSAKTVPSDWSTKLINIRNEFASQPSIQYIYGGNETQKRTIGTILSWRDIPASLPYKERPCEAGDKRRGDSYWNEKINRSGSPWLSYHTFPERISSS